MTTYPVRFRRSPSALWRDVGDRVLLASSGRQDVTKLSETASAAWHLLEVPRSVAELVGSLAEAYTVEGNAIAADVEHLLDELLSRGSIEEAPEDDG